MEGPRLVSTLVSRLSVDQFADFCTNQACSSKYSAAIGQYVLVR